MTRLTYKLVQYKAVFALIAVFAMGALFAPQFAHADDIFGIDYVEGKGVANEGGIALGDKDLRTMVADIINIALGMLGTVAVVIVLIGGFKWMTSGGAEEKVTEARKWIFSGIIGLAIIMSAWAIARFALVQLGQATNVNNGNFVNP